MNSKPLVSVVMNCFNCCDYLRESIDSVYAQTYTNWEIIFWDNASTDNSSQIAKSYDSKLKYFKADKTTPLYEARNFAIDKCNGELVAFLDCDDLWTENKLNLQLERISEETPLVFSRFIFIDQDSNKIQIESPHPNLNKTSHQLLINNPISISGVLIDYKILKKEKFNKVYNLLGDFELWFRLSLKYDFTLVEEVLEHSRQHPDATSLKYKKNWIKEQRIFYKELLRFKNARERVGLISIFRYILKCELISLISLVR